MAIFHAMHGPHPGLDLTTGEKLVLAIGGTLGVVGFVAVPTIALLRSGFRLRATLGAVDRNLRRLLCLSAWVALQPDVAVLLAAALVMGNQVAGGVVAYQFCFVAFLAPYAILAQPIHTTILPELTARRRDQRHAGVRRSTAVGARQHVASAAAGQRGVRRARAPGDACARGRQQP